MSVSHAPGPPRVADPCERAHMELLSPPASASGAWGPSSPGRRSMRSRAPAYLPPRIYGGEGILRERSARWCARSPPWGHRGAVAPTTGSE
eukprot:scaffold1762_cov383-Prasinococcus_capsulatus_cf.AAC.19